MKRYVFCAFAFGYWILSFPGRAPAVEFGWEPLAGGGIVYTVQVEPELLQSFQKEGFTSDVPPGLRDIRRIHLQIGNDALPNQGDINGPRIARAPNTSEVPSSSLAPSAAQSQAAISPMPVHGPAAGETNAMPDAAAANSAAVVGARNKSDAAGEPRTFDTADKNLPPAKSGEVVKKDTTANPSGSTASAAGVPPLLFLYRDSARSMPEASASEPPPSEKSTGGLSALSKIVAASQSSETSQPTVRPQLKADDGAWTDAREGDAGRSGFQVNAGMPAVNGPGGNSGGTTSAPEPASKPWLPLMLALLFLFASLGANAYLTWIHQEMRLKYRALLAGTSGSTVPN